MKDEDKTKEQLIEELIEIRDRFREIKTAWEEFGRALEKLTIFEKAFETMQIGVTISDLDGKIRYANPADLEMHGYTTEELKGENVKIFAPSKHWKRMTAEKIASMKRWKRESINRRKDGSDFPVQLMSDVLRDDDGNPMCIVTTCEDIADRKKMENEIVERIEELEKFYEAAVNREVKMKKLKEKIKKLENEGVVSCPDASENVTCSPDTTHK